MKRDDAAMFADKVIKKARDEGCFKKADPILDYVQSSCWEKDAIISDYQFDFLAIVNFGSNEGIYVDLVIDGIFNEKQTEKRRVHCGTIKTLCTDLESMQIMGELAGSLTYFANEVIRDNIDLYSPEEEIKARNARKGN